MLDCEAEIPRGNEGYDRPMKIHPLVAFMSHRFPKLCQPNENQTIDKGMVKFKGWSHLVQFMKDKPVKRGLKVFRRDDSDTGYLHQFEVNLEKTGMTARSKFGVYFDIVNHLTYPIHGGFLLNLVQQFVHECSSTSPPPET